MLLHSPPFAAGWNAFMGAVRKDLALDPRLRELVMCVVATVNGAEYEFYQHAPEYAKLGASEAQVQGLRTPDAAMHDSELYSAAERAVIALTIAMTRHVRVPDDVYAAARAVVGSDQEMVELVGVIAAYNMVSRFLEALWVTADGEQPAAEAPAGL